MKNSPLKQLISYSLLLASIFISQLQAQTYSVNQGKSKLDWLGKKVLGQRSGSIKIKEGNLTIIDKAPDKNTTGEIKIDMNSIICEDIKNPKKNKKLIIVILKFLKKI